MTEKQKGIVKAVNISREKGVPKNNINSCEITENGLLGDAHAADWHRQVSLLAEESIDKIRDKLPDIQFGAFAENLTTKGIDLVNLPIGKQMKIHDVILEVTQIGKECHQGCAIQQQTGKCVMPTDGIFTKVIRTGTIHTGDEIIILN
jgi:MOSC domain-containing protein YiiM